MVCPQCANPHCPDNPTQPCQGCGWVKGTEPHPARADLLPAALADIHPMNRLMKPHLDDPESQKFTESPAAAALRAELQRKVLENEAKK